MLQKVITVSNGAKSRKLINFNYTIEASNFEKEKIELDLNKYSFAGIGIILINRNKCFLAPTGAQGVTLSHLFGTS